MSRMPFFQDADWSTFWHEQPKDTSTMELDAFVSALAPGLIQGGFQRFHNGGLPLFERRLEEFVQEILVVPGPRWEGVGTANIRVHVSLPALREFRQRYWLRIHDAPALVAGGDVGKLDLPPGHMVWRVSQPGDAIEFLSQVVLPWLEPFEDFPTIALRLEENGYPLISHSAGLELIALFFGKVEGRRHYLRIRNHPLLSAQEQAFVDRMALSTGLVRRGTSLDSASG